mgnify:CR=1 FL=1
MKKLYFNGDFVPMTGEGDTFEALLVADDGTIAFTGSLEQRMPRRLISTAPALCPV